MRSEEAEKLQNEIYRKCQLRKQKRYYSRKAPLQIVKVDFE